MDRIGLGSTHGGGLRHLRLTVASRRGYGRDVRTLLLAVLAALVLASPAAAAPAWLPPANLGAETSDPPDSSSIGRVALGADGTAVAAWAQSSSGSWVLQVGRRKPGEAFSGPITVSGTTGVQTQSVRVGVDGAGNATILYQLGGALVVVPWPAASGEPGAKQPLEAGGAAELAVGRGGTAVATWLDNPNSMTPRVRAAVRPGPSGDFGTPAPISDLGDGPVPAITGLHAAVGDGGHATVVWSRDTLTNNLILVEANERAPGGSFTSNGISISSTLAPALSTEPVVAVDAAGRSTALWRHNGQIQYAEHAPTDPSLSWSPEQRVSTSPNTEDMPTVGAAPNGAVVAAWRSNGAIVTAARPAGGGAFAGFQPISGPAMNPSLPVVAVGGNGNALISWALGDQKSIPTVLRNANGTLGPILTAVTAANQPPGEDQNFFEPSIGIDDQGNGVAAWTRNAFRNPTSFYRFQATSFDAVAPSLTASVPPGGALAAPIGMAASAFDRVSPVAFHWAFGDGATATGGAVSHAFGTAGAFNVTVTATDAAGNAASATNPVLVAAGPPPKKKRINSKVKISWGVTSTRIFLIRLKIPKTPKKTKAVLTCKGKQCPFKRVSSKKRRKGAITLFKEVKTSKVRTMKRRTFRPGQRVELRITAPGYIGQVLRYKLKRAKVPTAKKLCLPVGAKKPRKRCP